MSSSFKYYRYEGLSYRVEEDSEGKPVAAFLLQLDGSWSPMDWGWQAIMTDNMAITEEEAFLLAGIKKVGISILKDSTIPITSAASTQTAKPSPSPTPATVSSTVPTPTPTPLPPPTPSTIPQAPVPSPQASSTTLKNSQPEKKENTKTETTP